MPTYTPEHPAPDVPPVLTAPAPLELPPLRWQLRDAAIKHGSMLDSSFRPLAAGQFLVMASAYYNLRFCKVLKIQTKPKSKFKLKSSMHTYVSVVVANSNINYTTTTTHKIGISDLSKILRIRRDTVPTPILAKLDAFSAPGEHPTSCKACEAEKFLDLEIDLNRHICGEVLCPSCGSFQKLKKICLTCGGLGHISAGTVLTTQFQEGSPGERMLQCMLKFDISYDRAKDLLFT